MKQTRMLALLTCTGLCLSGAATVHAAQEAPATTTITAITTTQTTLGTLDNVIVSSTLYTTTPDPFSSDGTQSATTTTTTDVTTSPYYPEYNPWYTDPETGNTYYMGTNAYRETRLEIVEYPQTEFLCGEPLNTDALKVFMIEQRNYNQKDYDVSAVLNIETDYDPNTPGTYTVYVSTDYASGEAATDVVLSYEVTVLEAVYTRLTMEGSMPLSTPLSSIDFPTCKGDLNHDTYLKVNDVILLSRYVAEDLTLNVNTLHLENADFNGDGEINVEDSTALLRFIAGFAKN